MRRDFTYVDDIVEGVVAHFRPPARGNPSGAGRPDPGRSRAPYGSTTSEQRTRRLMDMIGASNGPWDARRQGISADADGRRPPRDLRDVSDLVRDAGFHREPRLNSACSASWHGISNFSVSRRSPLKHAGGRTDRIVTATVPPSCDAPDPARVQGARWTAGGQRHHPGTALTSD